MADRLPFPYENSPRAGDTRNIVCGAFHCHASLYTCKVIWHIVPIMDECVLWLREKILPICFPLGSYCQRECFVLSRADLYVIPKSSWCFCKVQAHIKVGHQIELTI